MNLGKFIRLERMFNRKTKRTIIVPMDHGISIGPAKGLINMPNIVNQVAEGGANAVLMHKGVPRISHRASGKDIGLIIHLSASTVLTPFADSKILVGTVEDALRLGADAVSVHVNVGADDESKMLQDFGDIVSSANSWGMPVLAMIYARGPKIKNGFDQDIVAHCARIGTEIGADVVKVVYTGSIKSFEKVVKGAGIPVVIAGGERVNSERDIIQMAYDSVQAGGSGLSIGRNVFQSENPEKLTRALHAVVHENATVDQSMDILR